LTGRTRRFRAVGNFLNPDKTGPLDAALFSLNMLVATGAGARYSRARIRPVDEGCGFCRGMPDPGGGQIEKISSTSRSGEPAMSPGLQWHSCICSPADWISLLGPDFSPACLCAAAILFRVLQPKSFAFCDRQHQPSICFDAFRPSRRRSGRLLRGAAHPQVVALLFVMMPLVGRKGEQRPDRSAADLLAIAPLLLA
jgi:hypothetical protein